MLVIRPTSTANSLPISGISYTATNNYGTAGQIDANNRVVFRATGTTSGIVNGITAGTQYTITTYEYNTTGDCYNLISPVSTTFYTLSAEPTSHAASFTCNATSETQITLNFSAANTLTNGAGYVILQRTALPVANVPTDGTAYTVGNVIVAGTTVAAVINSNTTTSIVISGLTANTNYHFSLVPYNISGAINATINYRTQATIPLTNCTTLSFPEINVKGNGNTIADGDVVPQGTDNTSMGTVNLPGNIVKVFRIENTGTAVLNVSGITFVGGNNSEFALSAPIPIFPLTIAAGAFLDFNVTFTPAAAGVRNTTLTIACNDTDEATYDFLIQGTGFVVPLIDINLKGSGLSIADNSNFPSGLNGTAFGAATVGVTTVVRTFTIENLGSNNLTLTGTPFVTISGANANMFSVSAQPATGIIAGSGSITFQVTFNPTSFGFKVATINILNNDADESLYNFNISGNAKGTSNIYVYGNGGDVIKGATTTSLSNLTNFGGVAVTTGVKQNTFIITNLSGVNRTVSNVTINGLDASMFTIISQPNTGAISNGSSTSFTLNFTPISIGIKNATVTFTSSDPVDPSFTFAISGVGINFIPCTNGLVQIIAQQDFENVPATPTWTYPTPLTDGVNNITGGQFNNGSVLKDAFLGAKSFQTNALTTGTLSTTILNLDPIDTSVYNNINFSMRVGAFRTGSQGLDASDFIQLETSIDGGVNWSVEASLRGFSDSRWDFTGTGTYNAFFTGTNNGSTIDTRPGFSELATGISNFNVKNLPAVSSLLIRVIIKVDRTDEIWAIDNIKLEGQIPVTATWNGTTWLPGGTPPTSSIKAVIDGNYNIGTNGNIETCECLIKSGRTLDVTTGAVVTSNAYLEIQSNLTNNGILNIANNASLIQVNDAAINSGNPVNVVRTTTPYQQYDYTYVSSPVVGTFAPYITNNWRMDYAFLFNTGNFQDITTAATGAAPADGFDDNSNAWQLVNSASQMTEGVGYAIMAPTAGTFPATNSITYSGKVNNGIINVPLALSQNAASTIDDFNLIGNPYPSAISATDFINNNANISGTLYFWTHVADVSNVNPGPDVYNFITDDYALFNLTGGTRSSLTTPFSPVPSGFIASGQGFFVEANTATNVTFNNILRNKTHINTNFYRNSNSGIVGQSDRFWLNLQGVDQGFFSQQLIGYFPEASQDFDRGYDGIINPSQNSVSFYSIMNSDKYRIQGRGNFDQNDIIPLGFSCKVAGNYIINLDEKEGLFLDIQTDIFLQDNLLNIVHDLKQTPYSFVTSNGIFDNRFTLRYTNVLSSTNFSNIENNVKVITGNEKIGIKSYLEPIEKVLVFDILGRKIIEKNNINQNEVFFEKLNIHNQNLILKIILTNGQVLTKKILL